MPVFLLMGVKHKLNMKGDIKVVTNKVVGDEMNRT